MAVSISRWDPFQDLVSIQGELNRLFGRTFAGVDPAGGSSGGAWLPALDLYEGKDGFVITVELPGVDPKAVDVSVEDSTLTISGERTFTAETQDGQYHRVERRYGSFLRTLSLPPTAKVDGIKASFDKGVLTVEVPKAEEAKPRKITIKPIEPASA